MQRILSSLMVIGAVFGVQVGADPMVEGQVRLASGEPVAGAQVRLFDLRDLRSWVGTTTDETGSFALPLGILPGAAVQPEQFNLGSNYPNPFNPATVIPYRLQQSMSVRLEVFNVLGQHIATLVDGQQSEGLHSARWDGTDAAGQAVAAGMYLYRLSGEGVQATRSMVLIDGQAGVPAGASGGMPQAGVEATEAPAVYGLTVSGPGLMPFVDPAFRVAAGPVDLVVEASAGLSRAKAASLGSCSSGGVLGDVDNNSRVDFFDALLVALYSGDTSTVIPNNGDISLGDVNADGRVDSIDAYLIAAWLNDSADPTLPAGIGEGGSGVASPDCAALVALYKETDGDNWENNANWLSDAPLGEWFSVTTDADGRVTRLELDGNGLSGGLPPELGNLTNLRELDLYDNELSGALPSELGDLTNLESLYLDRNQLSGPLPLSLVNLTYLKDLNLRNTELCAPLDAEFQTWLDGIENKRGVVNCEGDEGDEPDDRAALVALYEATDGDNWKSNANWLSDAPLGEWFGVTTDDDGRVTRLELIDNELSGVLPSELGDLTNLEELSLSIGGDFLGELPSELGDLTNLELLSIGGGFSGELPSWLGNLTNLQFLWLGNNQFSGELPSWLGNLTNLEFLYLNHNQFSGELPSWLGNLTNLQTLSLRDNQFSDALPLSLVNLTNLFELRLENTQLCAPLDAGFQAWLEGIEDKRGVVNCGDDKPDDRAALVALYEATDGDNWRHNTNWLSDQPLGDWSGVITQNGRVTYLQLDGAGLSGTLPSSLGNLTHLQYLRLGHNQLSGALPSSLGNLTNLKSLSLSNSEFSGALPSSLGNLTNLEFLGLYGNEFSGALPSSLGNLTNLKSLELGFNQFSGALPSWLGNLTNLEFLGLYGNEFSGALPSWLGNLTNLKSLELGGNEFSGALPSWLGNLTNLEFLGLYGNEFSGALPSSLGNLTQLQKLWLFDTQFSGALPSELINLTNLQELHLRNTQLCAPLDASFQGWLAGIPTKSGVVNCEDPNPDRAVLVALYEATDGDNWANNTHWLSDRPVDEWHGVDTNNDGRVTKLELRENRLSGELPAELGNLIHLQELALGRNQLSGELPAELGNLTNLEWLYLHNNDFSGVLPAALGNLTKLEALGLSENRLSGELPAALGNLINLRGLWLYENQLSGELPAELGNLTNLEFLQLGDNELSGALPATLGNLTNLQTLDLYENGLSDALPRSLVNLTNLQTLTLFNTQLCAPTDAAFQRWLAGIPTKSGVVNCVDPNPDRAVLVALYEATDGANWTNNTNWLSDRPLAEWYGVTSNNDGRVTRLIVNDNGLSGTLPTSLGDLKSLEWLNLGNNELSGTLPASLGSLTRLQLLALQSNQFSGELPPSLGNLTELRLMQLSNNALSGILPESLVRLTSLAGLWLEGTQLCAPTDAAFQGWLAGIDNKVGVVNCGDDEPLSTAIELSVNQQTISEDADATQITVTVKLNGPALEEDAIVNVAINETSTATRDVDYVALFNPEVVIPAGQLSVQATLYVDPAADNLVEGDETIVLIGKVDGLLGDEVAITLTDSRAPDPINPDRAALVALYEATDGDNWTNNTNWLSDRPLGAWFGVNTDANGRVTELRLDRNALSGVLPSELGDLTNLQFLYLPINQLSGTLPVSLGNLTNLRELFLFENDFSGTLPVSLGNLTNLETLWLRDNQLSGVLPSELGDLTNLQYLVLGGNDFSGALPSWLGNLTNLIQLQLGGNDFSGTLPSSLGNLTHLQVLWLDNNQFSGTLPASLGNLTNLQELWLDNNQFSGLLPSSLGSLTNVDRLWLDNNQFSGSLPASLVNLTKLEYLYLYNTQLCAPTDAAFQRWLDGIDDKRGVEYCDDKPPSTAIVLSVNPQTISEGSGEIEITVTATLNGRARSENTTVTLSFDPSSSTATRDVDFNMAFASLYIVIPAGSIAGSTTIAIWADDDDRAEGDKTIVLNGAVDGLVGDEVAITIIDDDESLDNPDRSALVALYEATNGDNWTNDTNWLSDRPLNEWFGVTTDANGRVTRLQLANNDLSGALPAELGDLTNLQWLGFSVNDLSESLPSSLGNLTQLRVLVLDANAFSGTIPSSLGNLTQLQELYLGNNDFSGTIPSSLGNLTNLIYLYLDGNAFSGTIPSSLGNLAQLYTLHLQANAFSGSLPSSLGNLTTLVHMVLSDNRFSGELPSRLGNLTNLESLYLDGNAFSGVLPSSLGNLTNLESLWLHDTQLCAPTDAAFQRWLDGIDDKRGVVNCQPSSSAVSIPDANLRAVIEDKLGKTRGAPITLAEMATLTLLEAPNKNISDLTGLEFATSLTGLDLGFESVNNTIVQSNSISDISPLSGLTNLTWLDLYGNSISDISPLSGLTNLTWLELSSNSISDLTPLSGLTSLTQLYLRFNSISDISPLSGLTNLTLLWLRQNSISDISSLSGLTNLTSLFLNSNSISDISSLSGLTNLTWLVLNDNSISDISSLSDLTNLTGLFLDSNDLSGPLPSWLGNLTRLLRLTLRDNLQLSDELPPSLVNITNLQTLDLRNTQLCVPTDAAFQRWLEGIENKSGVEYCEDGGGSETPKMYWTDGGTANYTGKIQRANLDGSGVQDLVSGLDFPGDLVLDLNGGKMYWHEGVDIRRANLDGSGIQDLVSGVRGGIPTLSLDLSAGKMYWMGYPTTNYTGRIQRANLDGSGVQDLVTGLGGIWNLSLDLSGGKMYWVEGVEAESDGKFKIRRANLDGSGVQDLVSGLTHPRNLALAPSGGKIYWTEHETASSDAIDGKIQRANLDGSGVQDLVLGLARPERIALDLSAGKIYWTENGGFWTDGDGKIQRANLDGSGVQELVTGLDPIDLTLDLSAGKMYWTNAVTGSIQRANLDGSGVEDLVTGLGNPLDIALDTSEQSSLPRDDYEPDLEFTVGEAIEPIVLPDDSTLLQVGGGTPPYTYSVSGLPAGLWFDVATRTIEGTPAEATNGPITVIITVTDAHGASATLITFLITVNAE